MSWSTFLEPLGVPDVMSQNALSWAEVLHFTLLCCVFWTLSFVITTLVTPYLPYISSTYNKLDPARQSDWVSRVPSGINAVVASVASLWYMCTQEMDMDIEMMQWTHPNFTHYLDHALIFMTAYFIVDALAMLRHPDYYGSIFLVHHALFGLCVATKLATNYTTYASAFLLVAELSTPMINLRWFMIKLDLTNTMVFNVNLYVIAVVFFLCRIVSSLAAVAFCWAQMYYYGCTVSSFLMHFWSYFPLLLNSFWYIKFMKLIFLEKDGGKKKEGNKKKE